MLLIYIINLSPHSPNGPPHTPRVSRMMCPCRDSSALTKLGEGLSPKVRPRGMIGINDSPQVCDKLTPYLKGVTHDPVVECASFRGRNGVGGGLVVPGCAPYARGTEEGLAKSRSILNELVAVVIDEG